MSQQVYVAVDARPGLPGQLIGIGHNILDRRAGGEAAEQWTTQITGAVDDTIYGFDLLDEVTGELHQIREDSGTGSTVNGIALQLANAVNASLDVSGFARGSSVTDVVTVDARNPNYAFTMQNIQANMGSLTNSATAAAAASVAFGRGLVRTAQGDCAVPSASVLPAQVYTWDPAVLNLKEYAGTIVMRHGGKRYPWSFLSDAAALPAEVAAGVTGAINTAVGGDVAVEATGITDLVTVTGEIPGQGFDMIIGSGDGPLLETVQDPANLWLGSSVHTHAYEQDPATNSASYPGLSQVGIYASQGGGQTVKLAPGTVTADGGKVYCRSAATGAQENGEFLADDGTGTGFIVPGARYKGAAFTSVNTDLSANVLFNNVASAA